MNIVEKIEKSLSQLIREDKEKYDLYYTLWQEVSSIVMSSNSHLKQITSQLHNYDIHDESHCNKVLGNIEVLLGDTGINNLTFYELILLYSCVFLHDAAMALPQWEYEMLAAVKGTEECFDNRQVFFMRNDFKPVQKLSNVIDFIKKNKKAIYGNFNNLSKFIFSPATEENLEIDLAERVRDYEQFRNGYAEQLKVALKSTHEFLNYSELLRSEYIRATHHIRIEKYVINLKKRFTDKIGAVNSGRFMADLSMICRSHGEDFRFVQSLNNKSVIWKDEYANLQYISILLRLGDVIHFSSDRAPLSLFTEKKITDSTSLKHWTAKFQDLNYTIETRNGKRAIIFSAFCIDPEIYYFIHDYIDWIDVELNNYYSFIHNLEFVNYDNIEKYKIPLELTVDREKIIPNKDAFIPEKDLKFTLDQSKILSLLMGVQLYKDKYLCLRELYQNAMDACRCMLAQNQMMGISERFEIEFGMGECIINGFTQKYIYCFDNGIGMTKEIVKDYLLKIGNSYYKSRDFMKKNTNWFYGVTPTSQFGIGILSCFMIANRLEITTNYCDNRSDAFSFSLDGTNERFYYINPNKLDCEKIGYHGTLIKIFLNDECSAEINNDFPKKIHYLIHVRNNSSFNNRSQDKKILKNSLFYLINKQVALPKNEIFVQIRDKNNEVHRLIPWNEIFNYRAYPDVTIDDVEELWHEYHYLDGSKNPYKDVIKYRDFMKDIPIYVTDGEVEIHSLICLPLKSIGTYNVKLFDFSNYVWKDKGVLVDGIKTSNVNSFRNSLEDTLGRDIFSNSIINFIGKTRPTLSIDRSSIISIPDSLINNCKCLVDKFLDTLIVEVQKHFNDYNIEPDSEEATLIVDILVRKFPNMASEIINRLKVTKTGEIQLTDLQEETNGKNRIVDIINSSSLELQGLDMRNKSEATREVIIGKMMEAKEISVCDSDIKIISDRFIPIPNTLGNHFEDKSISTLALRADSWKGTYEEYDLVSSIWPIISPNLFDGLNCEYEVKDLVNGRARTISDFGNGIVGIAKLDPALINPKFGISSKNRDNHWGKKCYVGECDHIQNDYWLFELNKHGQLVRDEKKDFVLFVYISPRELNDLEETRLLDFQDNDEEYVKGVKEGWSILFIGHAKKYVIANGIVRRTDIIRKIPKSIANNKDGITYYNLDGTRAF